jgi:hypothetical protein
VHRIPTLTRTAPLRSGPLPWVLFGLIAVGLAIKFSQAQANPALDASAHCTALASADFSQVTDAPTQVTRASMVDPGRHGEPAYCRILAYITPQVGIELRLPAHGRNGKFLTVGCGGLCGEINAEQCEFAVRRGYACIASDMGHNSTGYDGKWAFNNLQGEVDYAYRATHVAALAGKAVTERYYLRKPERSYFVGCSGGGRQGLVEAQRFPWDFDGIVAGAPVIYHTLSSLHLLWATRLTQTATGTPILPRKSSSECTKRY